MVRDPPERIETDAVHAGEDPPPGTKAGDVVSPIHLASTFERDRIEGATTGYTYSRSGNPTREALTDRLAALEGGEHALAFSSGMGAIASAGLSLLEPGDHVVAFEYLYGGTRTLFDDLYAARLGVEVEYVDATDPANVETALRPETALVWMESPTNPLMKLCDIEAIARMSDDAVFVVDNTFASPYFQRPLDLGADLVVHSTTKYINGHTDAVGGAAITDDDDLHERLRFAQRYATGGVPSPFDAYLVLRGSKTLPARMRAHERNGMRVAEYLEGCEEVARVHYPGLESHPQRDLAVGQMSGFGGMLSFELEGGRGAAKALVEELSIFSLAVSLGGVESLIAHAATMTHSYVPEEKRERMGISDSLVRVSVGIESEADLIADLKEGFEAI